MSYTKRVLEEMEATPEPPPAAFTDRVNAEIDDEWLSGAEVTDQINAMRVWFLARYCDPAIETPYMSSEGYLFTRGGPYNPYDELTDRFDGIASEDAIEDLGEELFDLYGDEWAPTQLTYYDEAQDVLVDDEDAPTRRLEVRIHLLLAVLDLQGGEGARTTARMLVYAGVFAALETFLWETMAYWVESDEQTVVNIITKLPIFRDKSIKLGDIYVQKEGLKTEVKAYLQNLVWHRWESVSPLLRNGLGIDPPSFRPFIDAEAKRHHIVHRSGQDHEANPIQVSDDEVRGLAASVTSLAADLNGRIKARTQPALEF